MASIKDLKRFCKSQNRCGTCELNNTCTSYVFRYLPDNTDDIVDEWVKEHPVKTYAMDFFEKFPNAPKDRNGAPIACWKHIYGNRNDCGPGGCSKCWNQEIEG